ncbi:ATPase, T2SS/T4P/T4SS family [Telmatospirillum siberiense]|uniref:ATPase, T2SS/T4P/T4SS family n=1 Tax=Telmatospirillum siberiense TaxID=382514 RepID=UPI001304149B|nr:ATPase, T2SS/T4P/T4SS family [Telmatospirillum siberiense]
MRSESGFNPAGSQGRPTLATLDFADLYVNAAGSGYLRNGASTTLSVVPPSLNEALLGLVRSLTQRAAARPDRREFSISHDGATYRVALLDAIDGLWFVLRRGPAHVPMIRELGIHPRVAAELIELGRANNHGMVIVAGKTGDGKTTTACALLAAWLEYFGGVAVTIEDPPEFPLHGVKRSGEGYCFQRDVQESGFGEALGATMRYAPRFILLGEIRSEAAAREALRASINGHLVVTTLHAGSIEEAVQRLLDLAADGDGRAAVQATLAAGLSGVIHQRLQGDGGARRLEMKFLFPRPSLADPARAIIRAGRIEQLGTEIESQLNRILNGVGRGWPS